MEISKRLRACHISDCHDVNQSLDLLIPHNVDILFITGDMTYRGEEWELVKLLEQLSILKKRIPHIISIFGNHEVGCQGKEVELKERFKDVGVTLLHNDSIEIKGVKIFGSPYTPYFFGWAYQYQNTIYAAQYEDEDLMTGEEIWDQIPEDTTIVLSHCPPQFILDTCPNGSVGCPHLRRRIESIFSIRYNLFGHIHQGYGMTKIGGVTYSNGSIMDGKYKFVNKPNCFDLETYPT